jgi:hypothetical protein
MMHERIKRPFRNLWKTAIMLIEPNPHDYFRLAANQSYSIAFPQVNLHEFRKFHTQVLLADASRIENRTTETRMAT